MKEFNRGKRGFHWSAKAFYKDAVTKPYISFGLYLPDGSTHGEMAMVWEKSGTRRSPRLKCFDDAFAVLATFQDLIAELAKLDSTNFSQEEFVRVLLHCGFEDLTKYSDD